MGKGVYSDPNRQVTFSLAVLELLHEIALYAWEKIDTATEMNGSFTKMFQATLEPLEIYWKN